VDVTVDFDDQVVLETVEINEEASDRVLAAKLEAEHSAISQKSPSPSLSRGLMTPEVAGNTSRGTHGRKVNGRRAKTITQRRPPRSKILRSKEPPPSPGRERGRG
jgi:hypothetical protein